MNQDNQTQTKTATPYTTLAAHLTDAALADRLRQLGSPGGLPTEARRAFLFEAARRLDAAVRP